MTIIPTYFDRESELRAKRAGKMLLPEDVLQACADTAKALGISLDEVKDAVRTNQATMWG